MHRNILTFISFIDCPKTNFGSVVKDSLIRESLIQLHEAHQESHGEVSEIVCNLLICTVPTVSSEQILAVRDVNHQILLWCIETLVHYSVFPCYISTAKIK